MLHSKHFVTLQVLPDVAISLEPPAGAQPLAGVHCAVAPFFIMAQALPSLLADARSHCIFHLVPKEKRLT